MKTIEAEQLLEKVAAQLGEHFEAVQIMVSWNEECATKCAMRGAGNWYARQGMAHEFINRDIAQESAHQIAEKLKRNDDESGSAF